MELQLPAPLPTGVLTKAGSTQHPASTSSLPDNLHQHPLIPLTIELTVKDLFPGTKIEFAIANCDNDFPAHNRAFQMCIGIILKTVMFVLRIRLFGCKFFEPDFKIMMKS
jgi:hypothetical protein